MGLRIILGIFLDAAWESSRMLQDGSRIAQDGFKDRLGDFPGCGVSEFQDASGWVQDGPGWP